MPTKSASENKGPELSKCIARSSDQRTCEDSEGPRYEINCGEIAQSDSEVVHRVDAAEWHQHIATSDKKRRGGESHRVSRYQEGAGQMPPRAVILLQRQMPGHRPHVDHDDQTHWDRNEDDRRERDVPVPKVGD